MNVEGLIIGFIIMALGALFSQKKTADEPGKPSNSPQATRQRTMKRAEDYAKEIYGEFQTQMKDHPERTKQVARKVQETVERSPFAQQVQETVESSPYLKPEREVPAKKSTGRLNSNASAQGNALKSRSTAATMFPLEKEDLKKSIILSEILLPPKSKR
ncbi:hypothetical protein QWY14_01480 [Planococcus sp. N028]|uniref:Uncharacterized protein n=1 Tax=Planococcus shixiaomingii TaxID=3058393 RepID=A0ABT8MXR8_9BACL|nr:MULTISPECIES: hypothetical protein [unclassified Planococcus (in: firmicutes)]MDN7240436.1 hypothetical protein [Planococcus sp. N028]WKA56332.1 hypothetical protein QWY21_08300 [Planococcus sp. N022]